MYRLSLALTLLLMCFHAYGQVTPDVRRVVWGMTKEEVRKTEMLEEIGHGTPRDAVEILKERNHICSSVPYRGGRNKCVSHVYFP